MAQSDAHPRSLLIWGSGTHRPPHPHLPPRPLPPPQSAGKTASRPPHPHRGSARGPGPAGRGRGEEPGLAELPVGGRQPSGKFQAGAARARPPAAARPRGASRTARSLRCRAKPCGVRRAAPRSARRPGEPCGQRGAGAAPPSHLGAASGRGPAERHRRADTRASGGGTRCGAGRGAQPSPTAHCSRRPLRRRPSSASLPPPPSPLPSPGPSFPRHPARYKSPPPPYPPSRQTQALWPRGGSRAARTAGTRSRCRVPPPLSQRSLLLGGPRRSRAAPRCPCHDVGETRRGSAGGAERQGNEREEGETRGESGPQRKEEGDSGGEERSNAFEARMRKMELKRMRKRILRMWMKKKVVMRMMKETRMGKSRTDMQKSDLRRRRRMKWIQRDRRQKMGLPLETSPPISSVPSISPPPFQPVLALSISLWLHTISDEERLEKPSKQGIQQFPPHPKVRPIYDIPT